MERWLNDISPAVTAAIVVVLMLAGWGIGYARGRRHRAAGEEAAATKLGDATLALLGLLLAFTFTMSLDRHERRREMAVTDANALGDFHTCTALLPEPLRTRLREEIRAYVATRLALTKTTADAPVMERFLAEVQSSHGRMQDLVREAVDGGTPVVVPLVNTLNEVTSSHAARLAAFRDRLPPSVFLLLASIAVSALTLTGRQQGQAAEWRPDATGIFAVLVGLVIWVVLDLNQPQRGWISVSQEPLERLAESLEP